MLTLTRKKGQSIDFGNGVKISVDAVGRDRITLEIHNSMVRKGKLVQHKTKKKKQGNPYGRYQPATIKHPLTRKKQTNE